MLPVSQSLADLARFDRFIVVGADNSGDEARNWLTAHGKFVTAFVDLAPERQGVVRAGLKVFSPTGSLALVTPQTGFVIGIERQQEAERVLIERLCIDATRVFRFADSLFRGA